MPIVINTNLNSITAQRSLETVNRQHPAALLGSAHQQRAR
jgi:hypothetical protein